MEKVGKFKLTNNGGFVAKIAFVYLNSEGNRVKTNTSGDITLGKSKTVSPEDFNVPDGSVLDLYAFVVAGSDKEAEKMFIFDKTSTRVAKYKISGTTLHSSLEFDGIDESS